VDRYMLDQVTGGRPAAIFSKDQHTIWANSKALALAGITSRTRDPEGGWIVRLDRGEPSGLLKELSAYSPLLKLIEQPSPAQAQKLFGRLLKHAYSRGITGVHSFDRLDALPFYADLARRGELGLRVNYYPPSGILGRLSRAKIERDNANDYFTVSGIKMYADGALGSQSAFCFSKFIGSKDNYGVEATTKEEILRVMRKAAGLNLPLAVHAIGDRAIANVLDCFERAPRLADLARHRIEHLQMIRRKDIARLKRLGTVASMQPSHCPSDVTLVDRYWGKRGRNCFMFRTLLQKGIPLAFGSDAPTEPLDPLAGIDAAVNRPIPGKRGSFYPEERITVAEAVYGFTAGPAYAVGREHTRGRLLPGFKADFVLLSDDIFKISRSEIKKMEVLATVFDGRPVFRHHMLTVAL
ncbi:MAG: amidohydrolase, partial [Candidatus Zixiibacteriota bacterium]